MKSSKDYVIFSYFRNFVAKSDQKPKTKNGMNKQSYGVEIIDETATFEKSYLLLDEQGLNLWELSYVETGMA